MAKKTAPKNVEVQTLTAENVGALPVDLAQVENIQEATNMVDAEVQPEVVAEVVADAVANEPEVVKAAEAVEEFDLTAELNANAAKRNKFQKAHDALVEEIDEEEKELEPARAAIADMEKSIKVKKDQLKQLGTLLKSYGGSTGVGAKSPYAGDLGKKIFELVVKHDGISKAREYLLKNDAFKTEGFEEVPCAAVMSKWAVHYGYQPKKGRKADPVKLAEKEAKEKARQEALAEANKLSSQAA